ncbi:MAG TPA: UTP--glucose-1-phosphate uridylyltransferase, partial [Ilumatobacteraceae bacterium]|nr:UTP--glucose-1-phosphate uridylyltransferase [Ilumatobacteraceae bacterium]
AGAGIERVVVVTSHAKPAIEAYFADAPDVVAKLRSTGRHQVANQLERIGRDVQVTFAYQDEALGLGHAVGCAREAVGDEPFAVLLPDEIMGDSSLLAQMCDLSAATGGSVVGLKQVPMSEVSAYGVIDPSSALDDDGVISIRTMVEKPSMADAPSDLIIIGRYVLTPDVFDKIAAVQPGAGGEIQLTDALRMQAAAGPFHGVLRDIRRYDTGNPLGWLTAVVEIALDDEQIGAEFRTWLHGRV